MRISRPVINHTRIKRAGLLGSRYVVHISRIAPPGDHARIGNLNLRIKRLPRTVSLDVDALEGDYLLECLSYF